jgi:hypothetical protein
MVDWKTIIKNENGAGIFNPGFNIIREKDMIGESVRYEM